LPDRYFLTITEEEGWLRASTGDTVTMKGGDGEVRKGLALVNPQISGMHQTEYFKEALDVVGTSFPTRRLGIDGVESHVPSVNRKDLLSVITSVKVDQGGNQVAQVEILDARSPLPLSRTCGCSRTSGRIPFTRYPEGDTWFMDQMRTKW
jgi:hypothetical protein